MNKKGDLVLSIIFSLLFIIPGSSFLWYKGGDVKSEEKVEPPVFSENITNDVATYVEKTFPFRGDLIENLKSQNAAATLKYLDVKKSINDFFSLKTIHSIFNTHEYSNAIAKQDFLKTPATCTTPAEYYYSCECGACGNDFFEYGEPLGHSFTNYISNNDATCFEDGTKTATCDRCDATNTISDFNSKTGHRYSQEWSTNNTSHWHEPICGDTTERSSFGNHIFNSVILEEPTPTNEGKVSKTCVVCGYNIIEKIPRTTHVFDKKIINEKYLYQGATCTTPAIYFYSCECGEKGFTTFEYGEPLGHTYSPEWIYDDNSHWHKAICEHKDEISPKEKHNYIGTVTTKPTFNNKGSITYRCIECDYEYTRDVSPMIDPMTLESLAPVNVNEVMVGRDGWLFYNNDFSIDFYMGTNQASENELLEIDSAYYSLNDLCKLKGVKFSIVMGPNKEQVYPEYYPSIKTVNSYGSKREELIAERYANSELRFIYPLYELIADKVNGYTYHMKDSHWNPRGAYIAYQKFMESVDRKASPVEFETIVGTGGDLSFLSGIYSTYESYQEYYKEDVSPIVEGKPDDEYSHSTNESGEGRLFVFGDSFRVSMLPYAYKDFKEVYAYHRDNIGDFFSEDLIHQIREGDTLLLVSVERFDYRNVNAIKKIYEMLL